MEYIESCKNRTHGAIWRVAYLTVFSSFLCYLVWAIESDIPVATALFMLFMWTVVGMMWAFTILCILVILSLGMDGA